MAEHHHRRSDEHIAQEQALTDEPSFLKEILERVLQELLEAEMSEHVGAAPYTSAPMSAGAGATATNPARSRPG